MKKINLIPAVFIIALTGCKFGKTYTLTTFPVRFDAEVENPFMWQCVTKIKDTVTLDVLNPKVGDTVEIVHTDNTTSLYIVTDIK